MDPLKFSNSEAGGNFENMRVCMGRKEFSKTVMNFNKRFLDFP